MFRFVLISQCRTVVAALLVSLAETINKIGPAFIEDRTYLYFCVCLRC